MTKSKGFTLIELMILIIIIMTLLSAALSFIDTVQEVSPQNMVEFIPLEIR